MRIIHARKISRLERRLAGLAAGGILRRKPRIEKLETRALLAAEIAQDFDQREVHPPGCSCGSCGFPLEPQELIDQGLAREAAAAAVAGEGGESAESLAPLTDTFLLHSLPGANHTIFLDFDGHVTTGTTWNNGYGVSTINSPAYDIDGNAGSFNTTELQRIQRIWQRVAEDFAPFEVNVTTEDPGAAALSKSGSGDLTWGTRVVITDDTFANCGCGGHAYIGSFNDSVDEPVFVYNTSEIGVSAAATHEVGHAVYLSHDGTSSVTYYNGHGVNGTEEEWGPIMGSGYYTNMTTWDNGTYYDANNGTSGANYNRGPDDLQVITTYNGFGFRSDDHGNTTADASVLEIAGPNASDPTLQDVVDFGIITQPGDVDMFSFTTGAGLVNLTVNSYIAETHVSQGDGSYLLSYEGTPINNQGSNLDVLATIYDSSGSVVATSNPSGLSASFSNLNLAAGTYYVSVDGTGFGNWAANPPTGYGNYVSLGQFQITGTIVTGELNNPPVAINDSSSTDEDTAVIISVLANDDDLDDDVLNIASFTQGSNGNVTDNGNGTLSYAPNANFNGSDSFAYTIDDGRGGTDTAIVSVTVNPVNDGPTANDDSATTDQDVSVVISPLTNDVDVDGDTLSISGVTQAANGSVVDNQDGTLTYTPNAGHIGGDSFTYTANDGNGGTATATVNVTINEVNDTPIAVDDQVSTDEDVAVIVSVLANDSDPNGDPLSIASFTQGAGGSVTSNGDGTLTYTPNVDFNGTDSFAYTISDEKGGTDTANVNVTIAAVNDAPVSTDDSYSTNEGTTLNVAALGVIANDSDTEDDALTAILVAGPSSGNLNLNADGSFIYTPNAGFNGADNFTYKVNDGSLDSNVATVSISVDPIGPLVLFTDGFESGSFDAGGWVTTSKPTSVDTNSAFNGIYGAVAKKSGSFEKALSTLGYQDVGVEYARRTNNLGSGEFLFMEWFDGSVWTEVESTRSSVWGTNVAVIGGAADDNADFKIRFRVNGSGGKAQIMVDDVQIVGMPLGPPNDPPVTTNDNYSVDEDNSLIISAPGLLSNDSDLNGDPMTAVLKSNPSNGTLTLNVDGSFDYVPNADFNGTDTFTYAANDGKVDGNVATVTIVVNEVNDAPEATNDSYNVQENKSLTVNAPGLLTNDLDVDGDSITSAMVTDVSHGTLQLGADGSFTYTPNVDFTGTDSFTYVASDGTLTSDPVTVTLTVNSVVEFSVIDMTPDTVSTGSSINVTITGTGFVNGATVDLENGSGPSPAVTNVIVVDASTITATITAGSGGPRRNRFWDVRVTNPDNTTGVLIDGLTVTVGNGAAAASNSQHSGDSDGQATAATDVNGDGNTTALDALLVISHLSSRNGGPEGEWLASSSSDAGHTLDTNQDGRVTAADASLVINVMTRQRNQSDNGTTAATSPWVESADHFIKEFYSDDDDEMLDLIACDHQAFLS